MEVEDDRRNEVMKEGPPLITSISLSTFCPLISLLYVLPCLSLGKRQRGTQGRDERGIDRVDCVPLWTGTVPMTFAGFLWILVGWDGLLLLRLG